MSTPPDTLARYAAQIEALREPRKIEGDKIQ